MLLQPLDPARPDLLGESVDDLDAEIAMCTVRSTSGRRTPSMDAAVGLRSKKQPSSFRTVDALDGFPHQHPREVLVREPLAAFDRPW
jgi:hypothetical protein